MSVLCKECITPGLTPPACCCCCLRLTIGSLSSGGVFSAALSVSRTGVLFFPLSFLDDDDTSSESDERMLLLPHPFCRGCRTNDISWCLLIPESCMHREGPSQSQFASVFMKKYIPEDTSRMPTVEQNARRKNLTLLVIVLSISRDFRRRHCINPKAGPAFENMQPGKRA